MPSICGKKLPIRIRNINCFKGYAKAVASPIILAMNKSEAIKRAGSRAKLAELLGIKRQAVEKWPDDSIPALRLYQLKEKKPGWFRKRRAKSDADQVAATV